MKRFLFFVCLLSAFSCTDNKIQKADVVERVSFNLQQFAPAADLDTKAAIVDISTGYSVTWSETDTVGIYPNSGGQVYFSMSGGVGSHTASFDGGGWAFKYGALYYSYMPFIGDIYLDRNRIPVTFAGQTQVGLSSTANAGTYYYMCTPPTSAESGTLAFNYQHMCCLVRVNVTIDPGTYTKLSLTAENPVFLIDGYYDLMAEHPSFVGTKMSETISIDLKNFTFTNRSSAYVYLVLAPVDLKGKNVKVTITDSARTDYECMKTPSAAYVAGKMYGLGCSTWTKVPQNMGVGIGDWGDGDVIDGTAE